MTITPPEPPLQRQLCARKQHIQCFGRARRFATHPAVPSYPVVGASMTRPYGPTSSTSPGKGVKQIEGAQRGKGTGRGREAAQTRALGRTTLVLQFLGTFSRNRSHILAECVWQQNHGPQANYRNPRGWHPLRGRGYRVEESAACLGQLAPTSPTNLRVAAERSSPPRGSPIHFLGLSDARTCEAALSKDLTIDPAILRISTP